MRPDALRPATAKAAKATNPKLKTRLSKGEKRNRKRMAELATVYDATPVPRTATDILSGEEMTGLPCPAPVAKGKWLTASVAEEAASVLAQAFDEAERRDPGHVRTWVALVDGNNHQIGRIRAEAKTRQVRVPIVIDFVHVIEYLWAAAWCFFPEGDAQAEAWVREKGLAVLAGRAGIVAGAIRRRPPVSGWTTPGGPRPTSAPVTSSTSSVISTTPPPSSGAGRSRPGSSKARAVISSAIASISPVPGGACKARRQC